MIAIVLFIFLIIWILLTKFAMKIGRYLFRRFRPDNPRAERWGAFWGFMLAMGWVLVYWTVEAVLVRRYAAELCQQAGLKVYVTAEQWKNMVGGEETWKRIIPLNRNPLSMGADMENEVFIYDGKKYKIDYQYNERVVEYVRYETRPYSLLTDSIIYDRATRTILFQATSVSTGTNATDLLGSLMFWIPKWSNCRTEAENEERAKKLPDFRSTWYFYEHPEER